MARAARRGTLANRLTAKSIRHIPLRQAPKQLNRLLKNPLSPRLLKKVQMQGGARCEVRGVLRMYVAAPRERANAADGPFSAAC
jgi:hypothetical protein